MAKIDYAAGEVVEFRRKVGEMMAWCDKENMRPGTERIGWWWYVYERPDEPGRYAFGRLEGWKADQARQEAAGKPVVSFQPESGETEWIKRATVEYMQRHPVIGENHADHQEHFLATMARWAAATPWRYNADAA
jgi:hypothetical protein